MLSIALNPYFDPILRDHVLRAASSRGLSVEDLEMLLESEAEAIEFLKGCGISVYEAYVEASSAAVDHVGWVVTPAPGIARPTGKGRANGGGQPPS